MGRRSRRFCPASAAARAPALLPPVTVLHERPSPVALAVPPGIDATQVQWTLTREDGQVDTGISALAPRGRPELTLPPDLPQGYHRLDVVLRGEGS